jgi:sulfopyruvate decarboxylase subunit beta
MTRFEAVRALRVHIPSETCVVACNGMIGRELFTTGDSPQHFYMIGSMGLASSIGLGLALARPLRRIVVADGDGNVLMNLGTLASIGAARPANFYHVVFDNAAHASTGGQRTIADRVPLDDVARAAGYVRARVRSADEAIESALRWLFDGPGPALLRVPVDPGNAPGLKRVEPAPPEIARRFRAALAGDP